MTQANNSVNKLKQGKLREIINFFADLAVITNPSIYTLTSEIPTLSYTWSQKKVPLSGGASLYRPS